MPVQKWDIPDYVYKFINIHVAKLLRTSCFSLQDRDDLKQELLLFYIDKFFSCKELPSKELVFIALKNESGHILRSRLRALKNGGNATIPIIELEKVGIEIPDNLSLEDIENQIAFNDVVEKLSKKEAEVIKMVLQGYNLGEITKKLHVSYSIISRICEKLKKNNLVWLDFLTFGLFTFCVNKQKGTHHALYKAQTDI